MYRRLSNRAADKIWTEDDAVRMLRHLTANTECISGFGHEWQAHIQEDTDFDYTEARIDLSDLRTTHPKWDYPSEMGRFLLQVVRDVGDG